MKKKIVSTLMISAMLLLPLLTIGQMRGPSDPGGGPTGSDPPIGGGAPIGSGLVFLLTMGAVYGGKKLYQLYTDQKEELEE
ncbi:MAG: hypothetical protein Q8O72_09160 [Bacteroidales bacterium]|nr:hypothetical protein [Bacteroidales bacterium]